MGVVCRRPVTPGLHRRQLFVGRERADAIVDVWVMAGAGGTSWIGRSRAEAGRRSAQRVKGPERGHELLA